MKKIFSALILSAIVASSAFASSFDGRIVLAGSSTLAPVISEIARSFSEKYETWDKVDPSLPSAKIEIFVSGGGSGAGAKSLIDGSASFGLLARPASDQEKETVPGYTQYDLGIDALTVSVNPTNQVWQFKEGLSSEELRKIFSGEINTWNELDDRLPKDEIVVVIRDIGGGAHEVFQKAVMGESQVRKDAIQSPSMGALVAKVIDNQRSIGYASFGISNQNSGKLIPLAVDGIEPTAENIKSGAYNIARPLLVISKGDLSPAEAAFAKVLTDDAAMEIVEKAGFLPAR